MFFDDRNARYRNSRSIAMRRTRPCEIFAGLFFGFLAGCADPATGPEPSERPAHPFPALAAPLGLYGVGLPGGPSSDGCQAAVHREFDFWLGDWNVFNPSGAQVGTNRLLSRLDGCLVEENWTSATGVRGRSMNAYDAALGQWTQYWVDQAGLHLRLAGNRQGDAMVMQGQRIVIRADGSRFTIIDRIRWTPLSGGRVNQFWEISTDNGATFPIAAFNGTYVPTPNLVPALPSAQSGCANASYRELDFWTGSWVVSTPGGKVVGTSTVTRDLADCLIEEDFQGAEGYASQGFAGFDRRPGAWYRVHVDSRGVRLLLSGGLVDGAMTLSGVMPGPGSSGLHVRTTLNADGPDRVIQRVETSSNGTSWQDHSKLIYTRQ